MRGFEAHHLARFHEPAFQMQNALAGPQSRLQFVHMERLRKIVVRARLQAGLKGQDRANAVAVAAQCSEGLGQAGTARVVGCLGDATGLDDGDAGPQVNA